MAQSWQVIRVRTPRDGEDGLTHMRAWLQSLPDRPSLWKRLNGQKLPQFTLECLFSQQIIQFFVGIPSELAELVTHQLSAHFPQALITTVATGSELDPANNVFTDQSVAGGELRLRAPSQYPLLAADPKQEPDSLTSFLGWLSHLTIDQSAWFQIHLIPAGNSWAHAAEKPTTAGQPIEKELQNKLQSRIFKVSVRYAVATPQTATTKLLAQALPQTWNHMSTANNGWTARPWRRRSCLQKTMQQRQSLWRSQFLSTDEISTMFHFPDLHLVTQKNIDWGKSLPGEAPMKLPTPSAIDNDVVVMAKTEFHNNETPFGLHTIDRRRHLYVLGKSGSGKSTLLANLIIQDLKNGHGIAVLDPHGDLYDTILDYIPPDRINDVVIFDPSIQETAAQLNLFSGATDVQKELLASGMVGVFRKIYSYSWGPRLEYILRNCILTLLTQEATLQDINRMLVDGDYRHRVVAQLQDPILVSFWQNEFEAMTEKLKQEAIAPILNKVGQFVSSPLIRNVLNVKQSTFNVETIMNEGKIFLANLSQGKLGEDNAALLGALLVTTFQIAAMSRAHKPESERKDFYLFIDEFQNFATTGFLKILSEARKYRLNLILANQYMDQMEPEVKDALFGNVGTLLSFVLGAKDADWLKREFGGLYTENDLVSLGKYQAIVKLIVDGETTPAFPAETLALFANKNGNRKKVLEQSAMRFGRKR